MLYLRDGSVKGLTYTRGQKMARMYSGRRGIAGSKKPMNQNPSWVKYKAKEIEMLIVKLAKAGQTPSKIGLHLRDTYGVPSTKAIVNKRITAILDEKKLSKKLPEDLTSLMRRAVALRKHLEKNKHDMGAKHGLMITESKIHRLVKYYKSTKKLPQDWRYDSVNTEMMLE